MNTVRTFQRCDGVAVFFFGAVIFALAAATLSVCAPIAFSIATVFLFAGPHNWVEFRYFMSRLPARFGRMKRFFSWALAGVAALTVTNIALVAATHCKTISGETACVLFSCWNSALVLWALRLTLLTAAQRSGREWGWAVPVALLMIAVGWFSPTLFGLGLVYLHPFIGMWILDRELARSRPSWRSAYHALLLAVPILLLMIWWQLHNAPALPDSDKMIWRIMHRAGADALPVSGRLLVATHTFLETLHYGVWLIVIPIVSAGWQSFQPRSIPITWRSSLWKKLIAGAFLLSTFAVVALWLAFGLNFGVSTDVYFTLAIAHILAEIPFLLKGVM